MISLYEIEEQIRALNEMLVDEETGEINEDVEAYLANLKMDEEQKKDNIACFIKDLLAEADALKAEKVKLQKRQSSCEKKAEWLKNYLLVCTNGEKFKTTRCSVSFRRTQVAVLDDMSLIPEAYLRYKEPEFDKSAAKKVLAEGEIIPGCHLGESISTIIK